MLPVLRILLLILGLAAIVIGLSIVLLGPFATAWASEHLFNALAGWRAPLDGRWPPTMDSEIRFYAAFWAAYGIVTIAVARDLARFGHWVPGLALVFFAGGIARAISLTAVGAPHPLFIVLMAIELVLPPILITLWALARPPIP
jgi:hypothetical protein